MAEPALQHERIRFTRGEIANLGGLPSAEGQKFRTRRPMRRRRAKRWAARFSVAGACFLILAAGLVYLVGVSGVGREQLRARAERAIEAAVGRGMVTAIGGARIALDGSTLLGLEVTDVSLRPARAQAAVAEVGALSFGVRLLPLLFGRLELAGARIEDASFVAAPLDSDKPRDWTLPFRNEDGLLDPDKVPVVVFGGLQSVLAALRGSASGTLSLSDVTVVLPGETAHTLVITSAEASASADALSLSGEGTLDGRAWSIEGTAGTDGVSDKVSRLDLDLISPAPASTAGASRLGDIHAALNGAVAEGTRTRLTASTRIGSSTLDLGPRGAMSGDATLVLTAEDGTGQLRVEQLRAASGGSSILATGTITPRNAGADSGRKYDIELRSDQITAAAETSPDPPLTFQGSVSAVFYADAQRLDANEIDARTEHGRVNGSAAVQLRKGSTPGASLALTVDTLPIAEAKQLWPWFTGRNARLWALQHVSGGTLEQSSLSYHVEPGRIGSGEPLHPDELSGEFRILGTRFDTYGQLPPVNDADGYLVVRGTDAEISLAAGSMILPSGRSLRASDGRLVFRDVSIPPVIGKLDIDIAGDAAAAAELASLQPLNAMERTGLAADELHGTVKGNVTADIPVQKGVPREKLGWAVKLDYQGLSIDKPFDGQMLSDASGTLDVDPARAVVAAKGRLNGVPATINLLEPLRSGGPERERKVELSLNDTALTKLAPGLTGLVSGPVTLDLDVSDDTREVSVDLNKARLQVPWIGWSKGGGIPATARFLMRKSGARTQISDLTIGGSSFSATGSVALDAGGLSSADFAKVQFNRGDDLAVTVRRDGKTYEVGVNGKAFDARSLLKLINGEERKPEDSKAPSVSVQAKLGAVSGFNGETLSGVDVAYRSGGRLSLQGNTDTGAVVAVEDNSAAGVRKLDLRSEDAGSVLRFLNIYPNMQGGAIKAALASESGGPLKGRISANNFVIANEPRLGSLVSSRPAGGDKSLNEAVNGGIDTRRVSFERGSAEISKGQGFLTIADGVLRGPAIGATFQGTVFDRAGNMNLTGTFMPAYGLNRIFGELPIVGAILGNGNDRGLIGVTFRLEGRAKSPDLDVNPLSVIAPGIFRQIFEYN